MTRVGTISLVVVLVAGSLLGVGGIPAATATPESVSGSQTAINPDTVVLRADVGADGTAHWTIEYRVLLDDRNTTDAFTNLSEEIQTDSTPYTERFTDRMARTVRSAENTTGREMALRNVSVTTARQTIGQSYGIVRYRFTWTGFAVVDGPRIEIGDALAGFFLDSETQLRIDWPASYRTVTVSPDPTDRLDRAVVWQGSREFGPDGPRVTVTSEPAPTTTAPATPATPGTSSGSPLLPIAILAVAVGGALLAYRQGVFGSAKAESASQSPTDPETDEGDTTESDDPPEELLSNEEQVLKLLEENGGRIKQQQVATELDWTDAKTSQVVSKLRDADEIDAFRIGRENVLTLPDNDSI